MKRPTKKTSIKSLVEKAYKESGLDTLTDRDYDIPASADAAYDAFFKLLEKEGISQLCIDDTASAVDGWEEVLPKRGTLKYEFQGVRGDYYYRRI